MQQQRPDSRFSSDPLGWIVAIFLTPLLWRLEPVLHTELAGHSGPSDSIFYLVWAMLVPTLFALFFWKLRARRRARLHLP